MDTATGRFAVTWFRINRLRYEQPCRVQPDRSFAAPQFGNFTGNGLGQRHFRVLILAERGWEA